jgi:PAS domain S-box-containing protein
VFADLEIYRTVLEHMQIGIYMVDCEQQIQFWNDGAEIITGHLRQDVAGHFCRDFFPPQKAAGKNRVCEIDGALASVLRDGRPAIAEVTLRHKAGHQVVVRVRAVPIRNGIGKVVLTRNPPLKNQRTQQNLQGLPQPSRLPHRTERLPAVTGNMYRQRDFR